MSFRCRNVMCYFRFTLVDLIYTRFSDNDEQCRSERNRNKKKPRQIYRVHLSWTLLIFKMLPLITFKEKKNMLICVWFSVQTKTFNNFSFWKEKIMLFDRRTSDLLPTKCFSNRQIMATRNKTQKWSFSIKCRRERK